VTKWCDVEIFGQKVTILYNEFKTFTLKNKDGTPQIFSLIEVEDFLTRCIQYISNIKKFTWKYSYTVNDSSGNKMIIETRDFSKEPPFSQSDDLEILVYPQIADMIKTLEKRIPKKIIRGNNQFVAEMESLIKAIQDMTPKNAFEHINKTGNKMEPQTTKFSNVVWDIQRVGHKIKRYVKLAFDPSFISKTINDETLNTFSGWALDNYVANKKVEIKDTFIYEYFRDVWGWDDFENSQCQFLLNFIAWMLQNAAMRSHRIIILASKAEGTGKSSLFRILDMLFEGYTSFHVNLGTYLQPFNISDAFKKIIFVDDVHSATKMQVRQLIPKATCEKQKYQKKNEGDIDIDEYSEIFISSNQKAPLHIKPNSRRQLMLHASEIKLLDRDFFAKMKHSTRDLNTAKAWFDFFQKRDIRNFSPQSNPNNSFRAEAVQSCMQKSHRFVTEFFSEPEWFISYIHPECDFDNWLKAIQISAKEGYTVLRITQKRIYYLYKRFMKENYSGSKIRNANTFWDEVGDLGIHKYSSVRRVNGKQKMCVDLFYEKYLLKVKKLYKHLEINPWLHINFEEFTASMRKYDTPDFQN
jgi:hypothetical protein